MASSMQRTDECGVETSSAAAAGAGQGLGEMNGGTAGQMGDLLAAAEAVGHKDGCGRSGLDRWKQAVGSDGFRDFELARFKTEGAGHAATSGLDGLDIRAGLAEQGDLVGWSAEDSLVMAVAVDENLRAFEHAGC